MFKSRLFCLVPAAMAFAVSAFAVDGVTLISQATVQAAGGFPHVITVPGSYRLSSDLTAAHTTAIEIEAANVTLDLNGFTISCTACSGVPGVESTQAGTTVLNGTVSGFGGPEQAGKSYGVHFMASPAKLDRITVIGNEYGIYVENGVNLSVMNSTVSNNPAYGIYGGNGILTVTNSTISQDSNGIVANGTTLITGSAIVGNQIDGIWMETGTATITNNVITGNGTGVLAFGYAGMGSNTFSGNSADYSAAGAMSMKNNVCSGSSC